jgi:hypothetical protein
LKLFSIFGGLIMRQTIVASLFSVVFSVNAFADAPVGEKAAYKLDRSRERTTSMITAGEFLAEVKEFLPEGDAGPVYRTQLDYDITVSVMGSRKGSQDIDAPAEFFTPEFMVKLRAEGELQYPQFKIRHLGYEDATTMEGSAYPRCDKVFIYDIKTEGAENGFLNMVRAFAGKAPGGTQIKDLEITAWMNPQIPVLDAVKMDITGNVDGYDFKAGVDYVNP